MLTPRHPATSTDVAQHYDALALLYEQLWGEHLHHGLWDRANPAATIADATIRLLAVLVAPLDLQHGERVLDIGCGYGAPAAWIASTTGTQIVGLTNSIHQAAIASARPAPPRGRLTIARGDWLQNAFPDRSFDAAIALEVLAHLPDKATFFRELTRVLVPGGRAALACWTVAPDLSWPERLLLRNLCRAGRLSAIGTLAEYRALIHSAGLHLTSHRDLTVDVEPTWPRIARRALTSLPRHPRLLLAALHQLCHRPNLALVVPLMLLVYRTRALRYGILWLKTG